MQCVIPEDLNPQRYHSENLTLLQTLGFSPGDRDHLDNFLVVAFQRNLPPQFNLLHTSGPGYHHRTRTSEYKTCHWRFCTWRNDINLVLWEKQKYQFCVCAEYDCSTVVGSSLRFYRNTFYLQERNFICTWMSWTRPTSKAEMCRHHFTACTLI